MLIWLNDLCVGLLITAEKAISVSVCGSFGICCFQTSFGWFLIRACVHQFRLAVVFLRFSFETWIPFRPSTLRMPKMSFCAIGYGIIRAGFSRGAH